MAEGEWITGNIGVKVHGIPLNFEVTVPANPVKPQRMLPVFQKMANSIVDIGIEDVKSRGDSVSCKAGCGACCRQAVPISEAEVYDIAALVESMPEPRRSVIKKRFAAASTHFHKIGWFERLIECKKKARNEENEAAVREWVDIVVSYFREKIPCPFLEDESCSIHVSRPISCREYLVVSPTENCSDLSPQNVRMVNLLIKPSMALNKLGSTGNLGPIGFPMLIRALEIAEAFPEEFVEKTGPEWMKDFFSELSQSE